MSDERDWSDLPLELIHLISKKLPDLRDFIRFRTVCKTWYSSVSLSDAPLQFPWLLECDDRFGGARLKQGLRFYSVASGETGIIPIQEPHRGKLYRGPCSDYLLILDDRSDQHLSLFNPLTNKAISLPPAPVTSYPNDMALSPIWTGLDPILNRHIAFVAQQAQGPQPRRERGCCALYHHDKREWTVVGEWTLVDGDFHNCCYWDGMFFTIEGDHPSTRVFDAASKKELFKIPPPKDEHVCHTIIYLVESSGVILRVSWDLRWRDMFRIYRLNFGGKEQPCWVNVSNIGDQIVFLDLMNGFSMRAPTGFKGNCIYFNLWDAYRRYDIASGTVERLPCPFKRCAWFVPGLQ